MIKRAKRWLIIIVILIPWIFLIMPDYIQKALIHQHPDVDDYKIFPNDTVMATHPIPWPESKVFNKNNLPSDLLDSILALDPLAFLIIRQDSLLFEQYFNGHTQTSISNCFSVTKSIVSLMTGCALYDGLIESIDTPIYKIIPEFKSKERGEKLTIRHLLQMSSGIDYDESYASLFSPTTISYYGSNLKKQMLDLKIASDAGKHFDYIGANTQLLAMIIEKVTGKKMADYAEECLWNPLGAEAAALWSKDRTDGMVKAYCCFNATARDFARFGQLVCDSGRINRRQIIRQEYFIEMVKPALNLIDDNHPVDFYGLHWWLTRWNELEIVYARGIKGQYIITIPSKKIVIVRLGDKRSNIYQGNHPSDLFLYLRTGLKLIEDLNPKNAS